MIARSCSSPTGARSPGASIRGAHALGISCVAVCSDPDADAPYVAEADEFVRLPGATPADTYLDVDAAGRRGPSQRGRRRAPRVRVPVRGRRLRPGLCGGGARLRGAPARRHRGHGLEARRQGHHGGRRRARAPDRRDPLADAAEGPSSRRAVGAGGGRPRAGPCS